MNDEPATRGSHTSAQEAHPARTPHPANDAASALTRDFLAWLVAGPRPYREVMEAWRTSCPRLSIWEDALADGLVAVAHAPGARAGEAAVHLTDRGRAVLEAAATPTGDDGTTPRSFGIYADPEISGADSEDWLRARGFRRDGVAL